MKHSKVGHVIQILDPYRIIITGSLFDLEVGDHVEIYFEGGDIIDPDGNNLGPIIIVKDALEVVQVEDHYAVCEKKETQTVIKSPLAELVTSPLLKQKSETKRLPLNVDSSDIRSIPKPNMKILIGDPVRKA